MNDIEVKPEEVISFKVNLTENPDDSPQAIVLYDWFTHIGTKPRHGNLAKVLVDGKQTWSAVYQDMLSAKQQIQIATWMCRPDIELVREKHNAVSEPAERADKRFGEVLEMKTAEGIKANILIWGMAYTPVLNKWLRKWYWSTQDRIELLEQDHPKLIGSYHQKTMTIDGRIGYCGGMNIKENDWDTIEHPVFDPRRNPHKSKKSFRELVHLKKKKTKFLPRHDLTVRFEGPIVADLKANFIERWNNSVKAQESGLFSRFWRWLRKKLGNHPPVSITEPVINITSDMPGDQLAQIARTMPKNEQGILDQYRRAIRNARRYIYIENQYFRSRTIADELADACRKNPKLHIIAVVWPINDGKKSLTNTAAYYTAQTQDKIREVRPDFKLTRVMASDTDAQGSTKYIDIDVHAKVMIIDDAWLTVGSANINERGFKYEAEINAAILNKETARDLRLRLMAEHLNIPETEAETELGDIDNAVKLWEEHCQKNEIARTKGEPSNSQVHHFLQRSYNFPAFFIGESVF